jgi:hypothetical protein
MDYPIRLDIAPFNADTTLLNLYPSDSDEDDSTSLLPDGYIHLSYDEKIELGIIIRSNEDRAKFALGDLTASVLAPDAEISTDLTLKDFAHKINASPDTLRHYTKMAKFWPRQYREHQWPNLSFSILKEAMYYAQGDLQEAIRVCNHASALDLTVGDFKAYLDDQRRTRKDDYHKQVIHLTDLLGRLYSIVDNFISEDAEIRDEVLAVLGMER